MVGKVKTVFSRICVWIWSCISNLCPGKFSSRNVGILFKAKSLLNKKSLLSLYYSYIHSYIKCSSLSWGRTCRTNLKKINSQQKHVLCFIFNKTKFEDTSELFKSSKILNGYKLNIFNTAVFMHKIQRKFAPSIFLSKFWKPSHSSI